jgi:predicted secreted protein
MSYREAILNGAKAAADLHEELGTRPTIEGNRRGNIDVFGAILRRNIRLVFRPLDGLLGACVAGQGVIISTNRPLAVQRFIGSHELGHVVMRHNNSVDCEEILSGQRTGQSDLPEIEADSFAGEFLLPRWLLAYHAKRQGWGRDSMKNPVLVYQLSLRVGASYEATTRSLERYKIIDCQCRDRLLEMSPRTIKQQLVQGYAPAHWFRDVWLITEKDEGGFLEGQREDIFLFRLDEKVGAGYLWDFDMLRANGFVTLSDGRLQESGDAGTIGAAATRLLLANSPTEGKGELHLTLRRPWQAMALPAEQLNIVYDMRGKEVGLPRARRPEVVAAA